MKFKLLASGLITAVVSLTMWQPPILSADDFGEKTQKALEKGSGKLFGIKKVLDSSAPETSGAYRTLTQTAEDQLASGKGLKLEYLTRNAGDSTDMMAFFPVVHQLTLFHVLKVIVR